MEKVMCRVCSLTIISVMLATSSVWAQESSAEQESLCVVVPIFHCVQHLEGGSALGHFGYDLKCSDDVGTETEVYIDINENNLFSTEQKDRGQPKVFIAGKHIDEFEVDFSRAEVNAGSDIRWSVKGQAAVVDFSRTKDNYLDCSSM